MRGAIVVAAVVVLSAGCAGAKNTTAESPTASAAATSAAAPVEQAAPMGSTLTVTSADAIAAYTVANHRPVPAWALRPDRGCARTFGD